MIKVVMVILSLAGGNPTILDGFTSMATCEEAVSNVKSFGDGHVFRCMEIK